MSRSGAPLALHAALRAGESTGWWAPPALRIKESDRLATVTSELRRLGADIEEGPDFLSIRGCRRPHRRRHRQPQRPPHRHDAGHGRHPDLGQRYHPRRRSRRQVLPDFWSDYARLGGVFTRTE